MARRLKFPASCYKCGTVTKKGFLTRIKGKWMGHCDECYKKVTVTDIPPRTNP